MEAVKIVISSHVWSTGPDQELKKYLLRKKIDKLLYIGHPLMYHERLKGSGYEDYEKGILINEKYNKITKIHPICSYLKDVLLNIWYVLKTREKFDLYIGLDNLNAFSGWILKKLGIVSKSIYYVIDYTPKRFENSLLNWVYHKIESFCAVHCDETWNFSPRMIEARENLKGIRRSKCGTQKVVPMGIWYDEIKRYDFDQINKHQAVFMGHVLKKQGVQYVLDAIPSIVRNVPDFKFLIIGDGEYLESLKNRAKELNIEKYVKFTGYIENHKDIDKMIAKSAIAVALYEKADMGKNWTYYADPGKIKAYLGAGVPVIVTDVPHNAKIIEENKCGVIVNTNSEEISKVVTNILKDEEILHTYKRNAIVYASQFDWNLIFKSVL